MSSFQPLAWLVCDLQLGPFFWLLVLLNSVICCIYQVILSLKKINKFRDSTSSFLSSLKNPCPLIIGISHLLSLWCFRDGKEQNISLKLCLVFKLNYDESGDLPQLSNCTSQNAGRFHFLVILQNINRGLNWKENDSLKELTIMVMVSFLFPDMEYKYLIMFYPILRNTNLPRLYRNFRNGGFPVKPRFNTGFFKHSGKTLYLYLISKIEYDIFRDAFTDNALQLCPN